MLEGIKESSREMIEEQEAVRGRLFTIQDVMQGNVRSWLQVYIRTLVFYNNGDNDRCIKDWDPSMSGSRN